jgi:hypothetical protein
MKQRKLLVTQQRVYVMPMTQEERWLKITREAIEWINGPSSPLNRPELR